MSNLMWNTDAIARCATQYRSEALAEFGLKSCHASYLRYIYEHPGVSQEQLAQAIYFNKSSVARQLAALEEDGFVRREACEKDRRVICLYVTDKTAALIPRIREILREWEDMMIRDLTPEEQLALGSILEKLRDRAAAYVQQEG